MKFKATIMALLVAVSALGQTRQRIITDTTDLTRRLLTNETAIGFLNAIGGTTNGGISSGPAGVAPRDNSVTMVTNAFSVIQVQVTPGAVLNNTVTNATGISGAATNVVQAIASSEADAAAAAATNALPYFSAGTNVTVRTVSGASGTTNFIDVAKATGVMRVISPVAPENGDTNWFGPWTPGTVTAGIQEAINSLPISATGSSPGGGLIFFKPGRFDTTTNIHFPATLGSTPYSLTFKGSGMLASGIVGIFTRAQTVLTVGKPQSKTPYTFVMEDMFIASNTNACTNIITLAGASDSGGVNGGGIARAAIRGCFIGFWGSMTNNPCFSGNTLTPSSCADSVKHNLVAIDVDLNYNDPVSITENSFSYVNCAIAWACDHGVIGDNTFEHCGNTASLSDWPNTSPFYTGATIVFREPSGGLWNGNKDWRIRGNNFVNCPLHYLNTLPASAGYYRDINNPNIYDDTDESGSVLAATTGAPITFVNPKGYYFITNSSGITVHGALARYAVPNSANYSTWNTVAAPGNPLGGTNVIAIIDLRRGTNTGGMVFGDTVSAPAFVGDGSGLSNLPSPTVAGSGYALTNLNNPVVITVGKSNAMFGAWTPGTTTEGIQEALNALPKKYLTNNLAVGGKIVFGPGNYYITNTLVFTNLYLTSTTLEGAGKIASIIHYTGTNMGALAASYTPMGRLFLYVRDLGFVMDQNVTNAFWSIRQWADVGFERCHFTYDGYATNAVWGISPASTIPDPINFPKKCGGVDIAGADELRTWFKDCNFNGMAYGIYASAAHLSVDHCTFVQLGNHANGTTNGWPVTNSRSTGCGVIMDGMNYQATINRCDFVSGRAGFCLLNSVAGTFKAKDCYFEYMGGVYNDDLGAILQLENCSIMAGQRVAATDYTASAGTSTNTFSDGFIPANLDVYTSPIWSIYARGQNRVQMADDFVVTVKTNLVVSDGQFYGNGSGITNVPGIYGNLSRAATPVTTAGQVSYITVSNYTAISTNGFTGHQVQGALTNTASGTFAVSGTLQFFNTASVNGFAAIYTNGVKAGYEVQDSVSFDLLSPTMTRLVLGTQVFTVPANTRWELKWQGSGGNVEMETANLHVERLR